MGSEMCIRDRVPVLRVEYLYLSHIYSVIKWEAVSDFVIPADFWTDYSVVAYIALSFGRNGCMACRSDSGTDHHDCSIGFS